MHIKNLPINQKPIIVVEPTEVYYQGIISGLKNKNINYLIESNGELIFYAKDMGELINYFSAHYAYSQVRILMAKLLLLEMLYEGKSEELVAKYQIELDEVQKRAIPKTDDLIQYKETKDTASLFQDIITQFKQGGIIAQFNQEDIVSINLKLNKIEAELESDDFNADSTVDPIAAENLREEVARLRKEHEEFPNYMDFDEHISLLDSLTSFPLLNTPDQQDNSIAEFKGNLFSYALLEKALLECDRAFQLAIQPSKKQPSKKSSENLQQLEDASIAEIKETFTFSDTKELLDDNLIQRKFIKLIQALRQFDTPRLLRDPIILNSGFTYERSSILNQDGSYQVKQCPRTGILITAQQDNAAFKAILDALHSQLRSISAQISNKLDLDLLRTCIELGLSLRLDLLLTAEQSKELLAQAIKQNEHKLISFFIEVEKIPLHEDIKGGDSALKLALKGGNGEQSTIYLILNNLSNVKNSDINLLLSWAAKNGCAEVIEELKSKNKLESFSPSQLNLIISDAISSKQLVFVKAYIDKSNILTYFDELISSTKKFPSIILDFYKLFISTHIEANMPSYKTIARDLLAIIELIVNKQVVMGVEDFLTTHHKKFFLEDNSEAESTYIALRKALKLQLIQIAKNEYLLAMIRDENSPEGKFLNTKLQNLFAYKALSFFGIEPDSKSFAIAKVDDEKARKQLLKEEQQELRRAFNNL